MGDAGRDVDAPVVRRRRASVAPGRAVGRRADPKVVEHDAGPAERHVPVVGLVQVVVQPDDAALRRGRRGCACTISRPSGNHWRR